MRSLLPEEDAHMSDDLPEREEGRERREAADDPGGDGTPETDSVRRVTAVRLRGVAGFAGETLKRGAAAAGRAAGAAGDGMAGSAKAVGGRVGDVSVRAGRLVSETLGQVPVRRLSEPVTTWAANFGNALLATDVAGTLDRWTRTAFASGGASRYDRALDLTYNTLKQHGGDHRIFDGSHDPIGALRTIAEAFPDEGWLDRGEGYVSALWKDMVTPNGVPVVTWDKEAFDAVAGFLNETLGVSRNWSKDMVTFTATEFTGAALGALALVLSWNNAETRRFAEIVASLGLSAVVGANPLMVMVAIVGLAKCFHEARHEGGLKRVLSGGGRGMVGTTALLGASRLMPAPAWVTLVLGVVSYLVATRLYDKAEPKAEELGQIVRDWFGSREWTESCSELARNTYLRGKAVAGGVRESVLAGDMVNLASGLSTKLDVTPDAPTMAELGVDFNADGYFMFAAPDGIPETARETLSSAIAAVVMDESTKAGGFLRKAFGGPAVIQGAELEALLAADEAASAELLKAASE